MSALTTVYYSSIYPHLLYDIIFWGNIAQNNYESIFRMQKRAVELFTKSPKYSHTDPIFEQNKFLKLDSITKLEMCRLIHRVFFITIFFDLTLRSAVHSYITRSNSDIALTTVRTTTATKFVLYRGVQMYINLYDELKQIYNHDKFKLYLKTYLLLQNQ